MKDVSAAFLAALPADAIKGAVRLVTIDFGDDADLDGTKIVRRVLRKGVDFVWSGADGDGNTYIAENGEFGSIDTNINLEAPFYVLSLQNLKHPVNDTVRPWSVLRNTVDMNGKIVEIRIVLGGLATQPSLDHVEWTLSGFRLRGEYALFNVGPPHDVYSHKSPEITVAGGVCIYGYKDEDCGSTSELPDCAFTLTDCLERQVDPRISPYPAFDEGDGR